MENYQIKLPKFEGPFDLLLFFIERDELDIYDIPIAKITNDFLEYIQQMQELNLEVASEFVWVAASLMRIKAKMLIPRKPIDDAGQEIDPRTDLVNSLLEYKKYKSVLSTLQEMEEKRAFSFNKGNKTLAMEQLSEQYAVYEELTSVNLYKLLKAFHKALEKYKEVAEKPVHVVVQYPYSIAQQKVWITSLITAQLRVTFTEILSACTEKMELVFTFLAMLEMLQYGELDIQIGEGFNNFWLMPKAQ